MVALKSKKMGREKNQLAMEIGRSLLTWENIEIIQGVRF